MKTLAKEIEELRALILNGGDFVGFLGDLIARKDRRALGALLVMADFPEDFVHERFALAHAVESFPLPLYVDEFVKSIPKMTKVARKRFEFLLLRIIRAQPFFDAFLARLRSAAPAAREKVGAVLKLYRSSTEAPAFVANRRLALHHLKTTTGEPARAPKEKTERKGKR